MEDQTLWDDPEVRAWLRHAQTKVAPMVKNSTYCVTLMSGGDPDPKQAVEVGYMVLLDKPVIVATVAGAPVPANLRRLAAQVVEVDLLDPEFSQRVLAEAIEGLQNRRGRWEAEAGNP